MAENVEELFARFEEHLARSALASTTIVNYLADLRTFARWHADVRGAASSLLELTPDDIREYRRHMRINEGWTPATINRRLQAVRKFYSFAMETGLMESNPASEVRLIPRPEPKPPRALAPEEVASLFQAIQEGRPSLVKRDYAIVQLLLQTGIKLGELTRLRLSDVQLRGNGEGMLLVGGGNPREGNGSRRRQVPLNSLACAALRDYLRVRPPSASTENLFLSQEGSCISKRTVQRLIRLYTQAAGLEDVSAHALRHTFAVSTLADTGDV
ncbi:MAG: tyrosine-type recombinase/integrase, partial [Anaerolineales bacterium]|nr:tyrosine-type recombinase/integrase [Anaerolineales bacterium]